MNIKFVRRSSAALITILITTASYALPMQQSFDFNFQANQSLWSGGPSGGFDTGRQTFGLSVAGAFYDVAANSGTVEASVNGSLIASYDDLVTVGDAMVSLNYLGGSSNVSTALGASATAGFYYDISIGGFGFDGDINVIDIGTLVEPTATFTSNLGVTRSASDIDELAGVGSVNPCGSIFILPDCPIGGSINLDVAQTIEFTPTDIAGLVLIENQGSGDLGMTSFSLSDSNEILLDFSSLAAGTWDFTLTDLSLGNVFSSDIDMEIRPQLDYVIGSWSPGSIPIGLIDELFSLDFDTINNLGSFSITVAPIPVPAAVWLFGSALLGLAGIRRQSV